jgi:predicted metal-binding membrane protein
MTAERGTLEQILRRDRAVMLAGLVALTALAWAYLVWLSVQIHPADAVATPMPGMDMPGMQMPMNGLAPQAMPWSVAEFAIAFAMWAVMMIAMMTPSATPMILLYARVARQARAQKHPFASASWFSAGYLLAWTAIALMASLLQLLLVRAAVLTPMLTLASTIVGGLVLIAAGLYQWSSLKSACLIQCRAPLVFLQRQGGFRGTPSGALLLGLRHGVYCVGCCWALMALLFVVGVMNIFWIAALAIIVLVEKLAPRGEIVGRVLGLVLVVAGSIFLVRAAGL